MTTKQVAQRMFKDGVFNPHTEDEFHSKTSVYTMFKHEPEEWDDVNQTLYTITADYGDRKNYSTWIFHSARRALTVFRLLTGTGAGSV